MSSEGRSGVVAVEDECVDRNSTARAGLLGKFPENGERRARGSPPFSSGGDQPFCHNAGALGGSQPGWAVWACRHT